MTDDEIRVAVLKTLLDIREMTLKSFSEIEKLINDGDYERAEDKLAVFKAQFEAETLRTENEILKDRKE